MAEYDRDNIFAKILRGELPAQKVYEDDKVLALLDIMPRSDGHTLVIPKAASRNILDMDAQDLSAVIAVVQKIARAVMKAFGAQGVIVQQFNEPVSGQVVFHTHFHVVPCFDGVELRQAHGDMADQEVLKTHADKLRAVL